MLRTLLALIAVLTMAVATWFVIALHKVEDEKRRYSRLQYLESSHRGKLSEADLPMIYVPLEGIGAGEAYLVLGHPRHEVSGQWVLLDSLNREGNLFSVPGDVPASYSCQAILELGVDSRASPEVARLLLSSCN